METLDNTGTMCACPSLRDQPPVFLLSSEMTRDDVSFDDRFWSPAVALLVVSHNTASPLGLVERDGKFQNR